MPHNSLLQITRLGTVVPLGSPHSNNAHDVTFHGYTIPKSSTILSNFWAINRDPTIWKAPEEFDPGHFLDGEGKVYIPPEFTPFSTGKVDNLLSRSFREKRQHLLFHCHPPVVFKELIMFWARYSEILLPERLVDMAFKTSLFLLANMNLLFSSLLWIP